jgi:16S rRNA C967 or C1407 C5-methylase (RsmB/RsmF family)/NOL1/NOP2/fmu family ribosome biogenesis protein
MMELPVLFEQRMKIKLGSDFPEFISSLEHPPPTSIRINPQKKSALDTFEKVPWSKYGRYLEARPVFTMDPYFHAGAYYVQEASSMFVEQVFTQLIDPQSTLKILDLSAAPGGKSTHILSLINDKSLLVSNEVIRSRASILSENLIKWGYPNAVVTNNDPQDFQSLPDFFDIIVVDAPCSGEGLFRKDPDAMGEWSPENVSLCSARQKRIIADVWPALKEDGLFIYCTCTYNESENEDNLQWLRQQQGVEFLKLQLDGWNVEETVSAEAIGYRFFPHRVKGEGFFISVMRKKAMTEGARIKPKKKLTRAPKKIVEAVGPWLQNHHPFDFFLHNDSIFCLPAENVAQVEMLKEHLKILHAGTSITTVKHDKCIPEHSLAMSIHLNKNSFFNLAVSREDAIRYLRKDTIPFFETPRGYCLITFEGTPQGWVNSVSNRFNNLYPSEWRIRMTPP